MAVYKKWELLNRYFGGTRFRTLVQTYILRPLLNNANIYLERITDRYKLTCSEENDQLSILVHDRYNKGQVRSATILSGGERFMISLALSLALSSLNHPDMNVNILFIDEGFGTLDERNLDSVMSTLERLQEIAGEDSVMPGSAARMDSGGRPVATVNSPPISVNSWITVRLQAGSPSLAVSSVLSISHTTRVSLSSKLIRGFPFLNDSDNP